MRIGAYFVVPLYEGEILRDGGVTFGAIPKNQWTKLATPDVQNLIPMGLCSFLIQGNGVNILVDTGVGDKLGHEAETKDGIRRRNTLEELLAQVDITFNDIDVVILTHLHFAAAGGLTKVNEEGALEPAFPKARIVIQKDEWEQGIHTNLRTRRLYNKENYEALLWHQQLEMIEGDVQLFPGLWARLTGGHTEHHQIVQIDSEDEGAVFFGDLVPSTNHIPLNVISSLDSFPMTTMDKKAEWLNVCIKNHWVAFLSHDATAAAAQVSGSLRGPEELTIDTLMEHPA